MVSPPRGELLGVTPKQIRKIVSRSNRVSPPEGIYVVASGALGPLSHPPSDATRTQVANNVKFREAFSLDVRRWVSMRKYTYLHVFHRSFETEHGRWRRG